MSPSRPIYRVRLVSFLIETAREYFVSTRCRERPRGIIAYQLLTPCSIDSVAQAVQSLPRFTFIVISRGFFPTAYPLDGPKYGK